MTRSLWTRTLSPVLPIWPRLLVVTSLLGISCAFIAHITTDRTKTSSELPDASTLLASLKTPHDAGSDANCSICKDEVEDVVQLSCSHIFCRSCLTAWLLARNNEACPFCFRTVCRQSGNTSTVCAVLLCCWTTIGLLVAWAATHFLLYGLSQFGTVFLKARTICEVLILYTVALAFLDLAHHAINQQRNLGRNWWKEVSRGDQMDSIMAGVSIVVALGLGYCYVAWTPT